MEMRNRFLNHARNVWDRAVNLLPRVNQLWYKYAFMEEMLGNVTEARKVFERWISWDPDYQGWIIYIKFELRYGEVEKARNIYKKFIFKHPEVDNWIKYAKFEMKQGDESKTRTVFEQAIKNLGDNMGSVNLFKAFAQFEVICCEFIRARLIYKYALLHLQSNESKAIFEEYLAFEKQFGHQQGIEDVILNKKRFEYENEMHRNPILYDTFFDYLRLEESVGDAEKIRELYERAISHVPTVHSKHFWQRYVYLWIKYAFFEELEMNNLDKSF
jgi:crooked neck